MSTFAIQARSLGKKYRIGALKQPYNTLRETLTRVATLRRARTAEKPTLWALKDVTFDVRPGDVIGVIGRNGAGKSTLLKVLSRITEPTEGYADIRGRVGSLLEVGTGFHNELTGRENILLSGAILGMPRAEILRKFDEIVAFAEVAPFIDTALKHYSSGMYLRLAFAVAAHLEPSILLVDEVLAVGDLSFQKKCLSKMQEVGETGQTVLFVSHDLTAISRLAPTSMVLHEGQVRFFGPTADAVRLYAKDRRTDGEVLAERSDRTGDGVIRLQALRCCDARGEVVDNIGSGETVEIQIDYVSRLSTVVYEDIALDMRFTDALGHPITTFSTRFSRNFGARSLDGRGTLVCRIPTLALAEETYSIDLWLAYRGGLADWVVGAAQLRVVPGQYFETGQEPVKRKHGAALIQHQWAGHSEKEHHAAAV